MLRTTHLALAACGALALGVTTAGCTGGGGGGGGGGATAPLSDKSTNRGPKATSSPSPSPSPVSSPAESTTTTVSEPAPAPSDPAPAPAPAESGSLPAPYTPSADTRMVYVSASEGDDQNSGLTPDAPKKTLSAGVALLRTDYPDWLLLKRGDVWVDQTFGDWKKCGRSPSEPMVVWAYGPGTTRPLIKTGARTALQTQGSSGTPEVIHSLAIVGIHFYAHTRDPDGPDFTSTASAIGIRWLRGAHDITVDDCVLESFIFGIVVQDYYATGISNFTVRHCVVVDSYSDKDAGQGHSSGLYISQVDGLTIEDSVFDHNGYNELVTGGYPTIYNHNLYVQTNNKNVTVRRNILTRASSHALHLRPGGLAEDNFCFRNPINLQIGYDTNPDYPAGVVGALRNNVILEPVDIAADLPRGWGINYGKDNIQAVTTSGNIVAHVRTSSSNRRSIEQKANVTYESNIVWDYPVDSAAMGSVFNSAGPFSDPNRSVATYDELTGGPGSVEHFYTMIRARSRDAYDARFTAEAINAYFREGFQPQ